MAMEQHRLLDQALGLYQDRDEPLSLHRNFLLIEDCVETSASFVLHHLVKRSLCSPPPHSSNPSINNIVLFVAFNQPFSHYNRILRKLGCNLVAQRENNRFLFFDMLMFNCQDDNDGKQCKDGFLALFEKIQSTVVSLSVEKKNRIIIMIDDVSLMEVAANGSSDSVMNFLHYCHTLTSEFDCSVIALTHEDVYPNTERPSLLQYMEHLTDILVRAEPLATGSAIDVHGQLTIISKRLSNDGESSRSKIHNFHLKIRDNGVECFYPGSREL